jgi:hypothetical protein
MPSGVSQGVVVPASPPAVTGAKSIFAKFGIMLIAAFQTGAI